MGKSEKSIFNATASLLQMIIVSIIGLVLNKTIIDIYGSECNGIIYTTTNIITVLMVLEGGLSLASNVALFKPFAQKEIPIVNGILSATGKRFAKLGWMAFAIGCIISIIYPFLITASMPKLLLICIEFTVLIPACINLGFCMKYRVMILTDQKEYLIVYISTLTYLIGNVISIYFMYMGYSILTARIIIMISLLANSILIAIYCKKNYPFIRFDDNPLYEKIKGTKDVIILKLTSVLYSSIPVVVISTISGDGVILASIYAVYNSIISAINNCISSITNAPRFAFGALFAEERIEDARKYYNIYEMLSCMILSVIVGTTSLLLMPFINIYSLNFDDIEYKDPLLGIIMITTVIIKLIHIPSGQIIQMKGEFNVAKKIQIIACVILISFMLGGRILNGLYGIVLSILFASLALSILEITYASKKIFKRPVKFFLRNIIPCTIICITSIFIGFSNIIKLNNYLEFILSGIISVVILSIITLMMYWIFDRYFLVELLKLAKLYLNNLKRRENI